MMGPDIFSLPLVGGLVLFMLAIVMILFTVKLMPYIFTKKRSVLRYLDMIRFLVVFFPLVYAFASLFDYVEFDLFGWINFVIIMLSVTYILELLVKQMKVMRK